jgi:hypothetical protein
MLAASRDAAEPLFARPSWWPRFGELCEKAARPSMARAWRCSLACRARGGTWSGASEADDDDDDEELNEWRWRECGRGEAMATCRHRV